MPGPSNGDILAWMSLLVRANQPSVGFRLSLIVFCLSDKPLAFVES